MSGQLDALVADLRAAAAAAPQVASSAVRQGNVEAELGVSVKGLPGPALQSLLARHRGRATVHSEHVDPNLAPRIADHMASTLAGGATEPLRGQ